MEQEIVLGDKKKRTPPEPTLISELESGADILRELLRTHHTHLASVRILLLCTNKEIKSGGRERAGKVQKATPLLEYLTSKRGDDGAQILITVSLPKWNDADELGRTAMLDHLLTCVQADEDPENGNLKLSVVSPPLAVFAEIVERYGVHDPMLEELRAVLASSTPAVAMPIVR